MPTRTASAPSARERIAASPALGLCADFVNTRYWRGSAQPTETFVDLNAALKWLREAEVIDDVTLQSIDRRKPSAGNDRLLAGLVETREQLHALLAECVEQAPERPSLLPLEKWLAAVPARRHLGERQGRVGWRLPAFDGTARALLAPVIWSAADLLMGGMRERLRQCDNPQCRWLFLDDSKTGNRRWCSMSACGNRAKARRHYLRRTASGG